MRTSWSRDELAHLLSLSGNLAGLSITGVTIFHTIGASSTATIVDDILAITALLFLLCCYISFFALRLNQNGLTIKLIWIADSLFLLALTLMVASGFLMLYTLW
jgi:hypothetical protein